MALIMRIIPLPEQTAGSIIPDVTTSASYHGLKDIEILVGQSSISFEHGSHMPPKEYSYLLKKYGISNLSLFIELD